MLFRSGTMFSVFDSFFISVGTLVFPVSIMGSVIVGSFLLILIDGSFLVEWFDSLFVSISSLVLNGSRSLYVGDNGRFVMSGGSRWLL